MEDRIVQRICHMLANTEENTRNKALRDLKNFLSKKEDDIDPITMNKIAKALYYAIWMSDKPLKLRVVCVRIVQLHDVMKNTNNIYSYFHCLFESLSREWHLLDKHRMDKILLFVRILTAEILFFLNKNKWDITSIDRISDIITDEDTIYSKRSTGLGFQFSQIFVEEFNNNVEDLKGKNEFNKLSQLEGLHLLYPFLFIASTLDHKHMLDVLHSYVFHKLDTIESFDLSPIISTMRYLSEDQLIPFYNRKLMLSTLELYDNSDIKVKKLDKKTENTSKRFLENIKSAFDIPDSDLSDHNFLGECGDTDCLGCDSNNHFVSLSQRFGGTLKRRLYDLALLNKTKNYLIKTKASDEKSKSLLAKLRDPRVQDQLSFYSLYSIKRLKLMDRFKFSDELYKIVDLVRKNESISKHEVVIDVKKAIENIRNGVPQPSALSTPNSQKKDKRKVVFNLKKNQVTAIPKRKKSNLRPFSVPILV
ncbi:nucleolar protein,Nop52 domain-containing protein [Theileria equi strain WA]|uniref:Nucleolar protein,Nop52 domain-containing protein n=1 Tax=Theileria equi strain WA TaxID=1537102 RepID=L0B0B5_THEEQ|nr:nucleolar protein,Nop52 domain-containing protein [Theileria equi strain WA]AFZ81297.1 nucleolar protein,Nop52 domain-containing protein [Theileria equi strain WA]|eukprot:XP_004830963.1 nucleolar protein,Nop52 domain-containing protein [Theileria equi strain WA]